MCSLQIGLTCAGEPLELRVPCEYQKAAVMFVEALSQGAWPKLETARLELWPGEPPFVLRMEFVYSATVDHCADYTAQRRANRAAEEANEAAEEAARELENVNDLEKQPKKKEATA